VSTKLGLALAVSIAMHDIPEGGGGIRQWG